MDRRSSASVAAIAAIATLSFAPVSTPGMAAGASTMRTSASARPAIVRIACAGRRRRGPARRASERRSEKEAISATIATFGVRPKPNHATRSGAMSTIGIVCDPTSSGYSARRSTALSASRRRQARPSAIAMSMPKPISPAVTSVKLLTAGRGRRRATRDRRRRGQHDASITAEPRVRLQPPSRRAGPRPRSCAQCPQRARSRSATIARVAAPPRPLHVDLERATTRPGRGDMISTGRRGRSPPRRRA